MIELNTSSALSIGEGQFFYVLSDMNLKIEEGDARHLLHENFAQWAAGTAY